MVSFEAKVELRKIKLLDCFWLLSDFGESIIQSLVLNCPWAWKGGRVAVSMCLWSEGHNWLTNDVVGPELGADLKTKPRTSGRYLHATPRLCFCWYFSRRERFATMKAVALQTSAWVRRGWSHNLMCVSVFVQSVITVQGIRFCLLLMGERFH